MREGPPGFRDYVVARLDTMRRTAYLLCGDWHLADDIVSTALGRLLRHWRRVSAMEQPDAYVRRIIVRAAIDETRRPWRRERLTDQPPETSVPVAALATLPARYTRMPPVTECAKAGCTMFTEPGGQLDYVAVGNDGINPPGRSVDHFHPLGDGDAAEVYMSETAPTLAQLPLDETALLMLARNPVLRW